MKSVMKLARVLLAAAVLCVPLVAAAQGSPKQVLFTNIHVFDGLKKDRIENANVLTVRFRSLGKEVRLMTSVSWCTREPPQGFEGNVLGQSVTSPADFVEVSFLLFRSPQWRGLIDRVKLDLSEYPGCFEIDSLRVSKAAPYVESLEMRSRKPFSPGFGVKVKEFAMAMTFAPVGPDEVVLPETVRIRMAARAFLVKKIDETVVVTYGDYRRDAD